MKLNETIELHAYGTSEGAKKGWDSRGRGRKSGASGKAPLAVPKQVTPEQRKSLVEHYNKLGETIAHLHEKMADAQTAKGTMGKFLHLLKEVGDWMESGGHIVQLLTGINLAVTVASKIGGPVLVHALNWAWTTALPLVAQVTPTILGGGPGSGCRGDNCGRPAGSGVPSAEHGDVLEWHPNSAMTHRVLGDSMRLRQLYEDVYHEMKNESAGSRAHPIDCGGNIEKAALLIASGKYVTLNQPEQVSSLVDKIKGEADAMRAKGQKPPNWNLAEISVRGTNLFAQDQLSIPRVQMPQLAGLVLPGSKAAKLLPPNADLSRDEVDLAPAFVHSLEKHGIAVDKVSVPASHLRCTQSEIDGAKVGAIAARMLAGKLPPGKIFITQDNYILDGHHRWAATLVNDMRSGHPGDMKMAAYKLDIDIGTALARANAFMQDWGLTSAGMGHYVPPVKAAGTSEGAKKAWDTRGRKPKKEKKWKNMTDEERRAAAQKDPRQQKLPFNSEADVEGAVRHGRHHGTAHHHGHGHLGMHRPNPSGQGAGHHFPNPSLHFAETEGSEPPPGGIYQHATGTAKKFQAGGKGSGCHGDNCGRKPNERERAIADHAQGIYKPPKGPRTLRPGANKDYKTTAKRAEYNLAWHFERMKKLMHDEGLERDAASSRAMHEMKAEGEPDIPSQHGHLEAVLTFHPPSLRNPQRVPSDNPRETDDRFMDVTLRKTRMKQRMENFKHQMPASPLIPVKTTAIGHHMADGMGLQAKRSDIIRSRPVKMGLRGTRVMLPK